MLENAGVSPIDQGCAIIEDHISSKYSQISSVISEKVEGFIESLSDEPDEAFDTFAQNIIRGIDQAKAFRSRPLQVARRTFAVSRLVMLEAFDQREPSFEVLDTITEYINDKQSPADGFIHMNNELARRFRRSRGFGTIMLNCQPNIDPMADEPEVFPLIAGFALQSAAIGETKRVKADLESAADSFSHFDGDVWDLFDQ